MIALAERQPRPVVVELTRQMDGLRALVRRLEREEFTPGARKETLQRAANVLTGKVGYDGWLGGGS
ncbi:MAG: hypothetical protein ACYC2G_04725 [Gemmatimonadaceae bacterium]